MREDERHYAVMVGLGLNDLDPDDFDEEDLELGEGGQLYQVGGGGDLSVPQLSLTLTRLVLARWVAGEYSLDQVRAWLAHMQDAEALREALNNAPEMTLHPDPLRDAPDAELQAWLLESFHTHPWEAWDEAGQDRALAELDAYLPAGVTHTVLEVGWMGGDGGVLHLLEGWTVQQVQTHVKQAVDTRLRALEPEIAR